MDDRTPAHGGRVVARAWTDPAYRRLLLEDGNAACEQVGLERGLYKLVAVENTEKVHNVVVCTLCSCYPRFLLGLPRTGTRAVAIAHASSIAREKYCVNSERWSRTMSLCECMIQRLTCVTSLCRSARPEPKAGARRNSPNWLPATR